MNNDQLDRLSEILADLAKGLYLSSFGPAFFGQKQILLHVTAAVSVGSLLTILSLKVLELKKR